MYDVIIEKNSVALVFSALTKDFVDELLVSFVPNGSEVHFHISYVEERHDA